MSPSGFRAQGTGKGDHDVAEASIALVAVSGAVILVAATMWVMRKTSPSSESILSMLLAVGITVIGLLDVGKIVPPQSYRLLTLIGALAVCIVIAVGRMGGEGMHPNVKRLAAALSLVLSAVIAFIVIARQA